jgi:hypothetical protein
MIFKHALAIFIFLVRVRSFKLPVLKCASSTSSSKSILRALPPTEFILYGAGVLVIGAAAGALQLNLVQGDRGLGSFLSDGKGLGKSGYKPLTPAAAEEQDRQKLNGIKLPFRLPNLDFVDVYDEEGRVVATDDGVPVPSEEDMEDDGIRLG